jgi:hypothetical protein
VASGRRSGNPPLRLTTPEVTTTTSTVPVLAPVEDETTSSVVTSTEGPGDAKATTKVGPATSRAKPATTATPSTRRPTQADTSTPTAAPRATTTTDPYWPWGCYPFCDQLDD